MLLSNVSFGIDNALTKALPWDGWRCHWQRQRCLCGHTTLYMKVMNHFNYFVTYEAWFALDFANCEVPNPLQTLVFEVITRFTIVAFPTFVQESKINKIQKSHKYIGGGGCFGFILNYYAIRSCSRLTLYAPTSRASGDQVYFKGKPNNLYTSVPSCWQKQLPTNCLNWYSPCS